MSLAERQKAIDKANQRDWAVARARAAKLRNLSDVELTAVIAALEYLATPRRGSNVQMQEGAKRALRLIDESSGR